MSQSKPNLYTLQGHSVTINYSLSDITGKPSLNYKVDQFSGTAHKSGIKITHIASVGEIITIALHPGPSGDEGDPQFSFLLPAVSVDHPETKFETFGFKTTTARIGPAHQLYTTVPLHGSASSVKT
jgi:hypothetical protein